MRYNLLYRDCQKITAKIKAELYFKYDPSYPGGSAQSVIRLYYDSFDLMPAKTDFTVYTTGYSTTGTRLNWNLLYYGKDSNPFESIGPGKDQYGVYFNCGANPCYDAEHCETSVSSMGDVCYLSFNSDNTDLSKNITYDGSDPKWKYSYGDAQTGKDIDIPNPFDKGNPTTAAYCNVPGSGSKSGTVNLNQNDPDYNFPSFPRFFDSNNDPGTGQKGVYRLDQQSSKIVTTHIDGGGLTADGCISTYLACPGIGAEFDAQQLSYGIVRCKVPTTYCPSLNETVNPPGGYDLQYFSASFNQQANLTFYPKYWTVNGTMLRNNMDAQNYAYMLFVPNIALEAYLGNNDDVNRVTPPLVQWGQYKCFLMAAPTYAILFRYKDVNADWVGNPKNAPCYKTLEENKPIPSTALGGFCPEVYCDTTSTGYSSVEEFLNVPNIGAVTKDGPWPTSTLSNS